MSRGEGRLVRRSGWVAVRKTGSTFSKTVLQEMKQGVLFRDGDVQIRGEIARCAETRTRITPFLPAMLEEMLQRIEPGFTDVRVAIQVVGRIEAGKRVAKQRTALRG